MDIKSNNKNNGLDKITRQLLLRMLSAVVLYTGLGIGTYWLIVIIYRQFRWKGGEIIYLLAHWLDLRADLFALAYIMIGYCAIFLYFWLRPFRFLSEVLKATEAIYDRSDSLIELSPPLKEVEAQMNRIKITMQNNELAAREGEQRKNDLVSYLAHDLKTPLTSLIGYLTLLRDENKISRELQERYLSISIDKAERLDDLINEFFEITRFNLSHISLAYERVNLTRMLEQLIYEFKPMLAEKNLDCILAAAADIMIRCDADKLQRVFDNLLHNAVNYSFENNSIQITVALLKDRVKLSFENNGNTIPKDELDRVFEQFYRLDSARSSKSGRAGLGLAIAKEIVELHQGSISAFSENEMIRFEAELPVSNKP